MNTKKRQNGEIVRQRVVNWKDSNGRIRLHPVKADLSAKKRKLNPPNDLSDSTVPLSTGIESIELDNNPDGPEMMQGTRQTQVSSLELLTRQLLTPA